MPWGTVRVNSPAGRDVYINGNYAAAAGQLPGAFVVEYGPNSFETLNVSNEIDFRGEASVDAAHSHVVIDLAPVVPPEPSGV